MDRLGIESGLDTKTPGEIRLSAEPSQYGDLPEDEKLKEFDDHKAEDTRCIVCRQHYVVWCGDKKWRCEIHSKEWQRNE